MEKVDTRHAAPITPADSARAAEAKGVHAPSGLAASAILRYRAGSFIAILIGTVLSITAFFAISDKERDLTRLAFEQKVQSNAAAINLAMERGLESVENSGALFDPGYRITKAQFQAFARRALARNPALKAVGWTPLVRGSERTAFEAAARKDEPGFGIKELNAQFKLVPAGEREEYFPIRYSVDRDGPGYNPFGMDRLSVANSRGGLARSRASGEATASGRIRITTGEFQGDMGVALSRPVYRQGLPLATPEQRATNLVGFTISIVVVRNLIDNVLKRLGSEGLRVVLYDDSAPEAERFLAVWPDVEQKDPAASGNEAAPLRHDVKFTVGDRNWVATMTPEPGQFDAAPSWPAWSVLVAGLLFSLLVVIYLESARRHTRSTQEQAATDPLTGLYNRRYLWDMLNREFARARRDRTTIAAVMIDIDHFKRINDTEGHDAGDAVLVALGALLKRCVRASDVACRYGGEEFMLILPGISAQNAQRKAELLRGEAKNLRLEHRGAPLGPATISLGVALFPFDAEGPDSLLRAADEAMYEAKRTGRDRVVVAKPAAAMPAVAPATA